MEYISTEKNTGAAVVVRRTHFRTTLRQLTTQQLQILLSQSLDMITQHRRQMTSIASQKQLV